MSRSNNECADVHTHNAEVRADTPRRCVVFNVSFERQSVYATKKHHHQKPAAPPPFLEERDDGAAPSLLLSSSSSSPPSVLGNWVGGDRLSFAKSTTPRVKVSAVDDDERAVVERARGRKKNEEAHRQRADATNTASREREEDGGDEGDQRSVVANPIVIAAGRRRRRGRENNRDARSEMRTERGQLRGTNGRDAVGWADRCAARVVEANEELASGEKSSDNRTRAVGNALIGGTPLIDVTNVLSLNPTNVKIYAKCEYMNPSGSIKDRIASYILQAAIDSGDLKEGMTVVAATAGTPGAPSPRRALFEGSIISSSRIRNVRSRKSIA